MPAPIRPVSTPAAAVTSLKVEPEVDLPVALGEQWRIRVGDQSVEGGVRDRAVGISERVRVKAGERPQSDDLAGLRIERDDRALAVAECLRCDPLDIVADRQRERGGGVAIDEEIAERGKALVDRIAGEFVVVAAFESNGLDVERLIAGDVRVELPSGYSLRKSTDPSYSTDRATSTPSAVMIGPRSRPNSRIKPRVLLTSSCRRSTPKNWIRLSCRNSTRYSTLSTTPRRRIRRFTLRPSPDGSRPAAHVTCERAAQAGHSWRRATNRRS